MSGGEENQQQGQSAVLTPRQQHRSELIQHLREKRHGLRAQLEQLESLEARKAELRGKLDAVQLDLERLGWVDPPVLDVGLAEVELGKKAGEAEFEAVGQGG